MAPEAEAWAAAEVALVAPHLETVAVADFPVEVPPEAAVCQVVCPVVCPADTVQGGCPQAMDDDQYTSTQVDFIAVQVAQVASPLFSSF